MESDDGFQSFSEAIATDPVRMLLVMWRRDDFIAKLEELPDVVEVIESGSLARGTQVGPVHDVDLIVVFDKSKHPDYGIKGNSAKAAESAQAAITHLENELREQLHPWLGAGEGLPKETEQRTHVVTCYADWTVALADIMPVAPPVDVMPAVREGGPLERPHLLVPERGTGWVDVDPETFMRQVEQRQREWKYFKEVVGMVKAWAELNHLDMKSVAIEVMVLKYCPRPGLFETLSCGEAVARFFEAAAKAHITSLKDPAGRCGEIDRKMDFSELRKALNRAAGLARQAMDAEHIWEHPYRAPGPVRDPSELWRELFGRKFPRARKRFLRPAATGPWSDVSTAKPVPKVRRDNPDPPDDNPRPNGPGGSSPTGPHRDPDDPHRGPSHGPGPGPRRPRPHRPPDGPSAWPGAPRNGGGSGSRPAPRPSPRHGVASAQPGAGLWTRILGPATVSVPLTFG
jgi:hypothetical protein